MHLVEPYYRWRSLYEAENDEASPFYGRTYSEFEFHNRVYNFYIHPQWDEIGSSTLFLKIIFVDYTEGFVVIELMGEWNDAIENDVMTLKRDVIDDLIGMEIKQFLLIGENVLNFHSSDDCYYEEWTDDVEDGWVAMINFHEHVTAEMEQVGIDQYFIMGGEMEMLEWRTYLPHQLHNKVKEIVEARFQ